MLALLPLAPGLLLNQFVRAPHQFVRASMPQMAEGAFVIVGASKGIGLELTKLAVASDKNVFATCRKATPELSALEGVTVIEDIDLIDDSCGEKLKSALGDTEVHTVVYNAGMGDSSGSMLGTGVNTQTMDDCSVDQMRDMMDVNGYGVFKVAKAIKPSIKSPGGKWCTIATCAASLAETAGPEEGPFGSGNFSPFFAYRATKVAGMMLTQTMAGPFAKEGIAVSCIHPGVGATDLTMGGIAEDGKPFIPPDMEGMMFMPSELAAGVMLAVEGTNMDNTGQFLDGNYGKEVTTRPW